MADNIKVTNCHILTPVLIINNFNNLYSLVQLLIITLNLH